LTRLTVSRQCRLLDWSLADDILGRLVVAQAEEARVAEAPVTCPLSEADLYDEPRLDPCRVPFLDLVGERR
jgi:hypothetical protein